MRKIYDCFPFFNEYDLLELRLEEAYDHVDYFVISESDRSFQNKPKPWNLENNWSRYEKYHDKIIYLKITDMPHGEGNQANWIRENFQRDVLARGIGDASPNDVIVISDCDEMLRPSTYDLLRSDTEHYFWMCRQPIFWTRFNYWQANPRGYNISSMAILKSHLINPQEIRNRMNWAYTLPENFDQNGMRFIHHAGWHFTYLGNDDNAKNKLLNFAHDECTHLASRLNIDEAISANKNPIDQKDPTQFLPVKLNDYFPKTVVNNIEKYKDYIIQDVDTDIRGHLPTYD